MELERKGALETLYILYFYIIIPTGYHPTSLYLVKSLFPNHECVARLTIAQDSYRQGDGKSVTQVQVDPQFKASRTGTKTTTAYHSLEVKALTAVKVQGLRLTSS